MQHRQPINPLESTDCSLADTLSEPRHTGGHAPNIDPHIHLHSFVELEPTVPQRLLTSTMQKAVHAAAGVLSYPSLYRHLPLLEVEARHQTQVVGPAWVLQHGVVLVAPDSGLAG